LCKFKSNGDKYSVVQFSGWRQVRQQLERFSNYGKRKVSQFLT